MVLQLLAVPVLRKRQRQILLSLGRMVQLLLLKLPLQERMKNLAAGKLIIESDAAD
jgi:hypothetical protein